MSKITIRSKLKQIHIPCDDCIIKVKYGDMITPATIAIMEYDYETALKENDSYPYMDYAKFQTKLVEAIELYYEKNKDLVERIGLPKIPVLFSTEIEDQAIIITHVRSTKRKKVQINGTFYPLVGMESTTIIVQING